MLIEFLQHFKEASDAQEQSQPTLLLVPIWYKRLKKHLHPSTTDVYSLSQLKSQASQDLIENVEIKPLHRVAVFLHPQMKGMKVFSEQEGQEFYQETKKLVLLQEKNIPAVNITVTQTPSPKDDNGHIQSLRIQIANVEVTMMKLTKNEDVLSPPLQQLYKQLSPSQTSCMICAFHPCI
ncbi:unnamed protein product [Caretta caretta]